MSAEDATAKVLRLVREAEDDVARQEAAVASLRNSGKHHAMNEAREVLVILVDSLESHRTHLANLLAKA
jgi:hypothetical protein